MVALMTVAFIGIAALAIDTGIWFVARSEAQRAAESGAHAGAGYLMMAPGDGNGARVEAESFAEQNVVRGVVPDVIPNTDIDVILDSQKVRVRVQRSDARGNPLTTVFARVMGIDQVDIGAMAAAQSWP
ncbi:MAG: Tad domain-containing protein, partial [Acidobacteriota bacterium]|nr:Tad domain-containing protein [Acidobacteriota bacterium]